MTLGRPRERTVSVGEKLAAKEAKQRKRKIGDSLRAHARTHAHTHAHPRVYCYTVTLPPLPLATPAPALSAGGPMRDYVGNPHAAPPPPLTGRAVAWADFPPPRALVFMNHCSYRFQCISVHRLGSARCKLGSCSVPARSSPACASPVPAVPCSVPLDAGSGGKYSAR